VLVARFNAVAAPFGQDALLQFHRQIGYIGLGFILVHFAISAKWNEVTLSQALAAPLLVWFGMAALFALVVLVATSLWRKVLRLSYEVWHVIRSVLAVVLIVGALGHVFFVDEYVSSLWKQILWGLMSAAFVALLVWVRVVKPRLALSRPWLRCTRSARAWPDDHGRADPACGDGLQLPAGTVCMVRVRALAVLAHPAPIFVLVKR
jgi:predicted ferric reductase